MNVREVNARLNLGDHVAIQCPTLDYTEASGPPRLHHTTPVSEHLYAPNLQHSAISCVRSARLRGHDHAKAWGCRLETATEHETITRFKEVKKGWDAREAESSDKDGCIESSMALFFLDTGLPFLIDFGVCLENYAGEDWNGMGDK